MGSGGTGSGGMRSGFSCHERKTGRYLWSHRAGRRDACGTVSGESSAIRPWLPLENENVEPGMKWQAGRLPYFGK